MTTTAQSIRRARLTGGLSHLFVALTLAVPWLVASLMPDSFDDLSFWLLLGAMVMSASSWMSLVSIVGKLGDRVGWLLLGTPTLLISGFGIVMAPQQSAVVEFSIVTTIVLALYALSRVALGEKRAIWPWLPFLLPVLAIGAFAYLREPLNGDPELASWLVFIMCLKFVVPAVLLCLALSTYLCGVAAFAIARASGSSIHRVLGTLLFLSAPGLLVSFITSLFWYTEMTFVVFLVAGINALQALVFATLKMRT